MVNLPTNQPPNPKFTSHYDITAFLLFWSFIHNQSSIENSCIQISIFFLFIFHIVVPGQFVSMSLNYCNIRGISVCQKSQMFFMLRLLHFEGIPFYKFNWVFFFSKKKKLIFKTMCILKIYSWNNITLTLLRFSLKAQRQWCHSMPNQLWIFWAPSDFNEIWLVLLYLLTNTKLDRGRKYGRSKFPPESVSFGGLARKNKKVYKYWITAYTKIKEHRNGTKKLSLSQYCLLLKYVSYLSFFKLFAPVLFTS